MKLVLLLAFICMIVVTWANPGPAPQPPGGKFPGPPPGGPPGGPPPRNRTSSFTHGAGFARSADAPPSPPPPPPKNSN